MSEVGHFVVADLTVRGDLQLQADYSYALLERVPGALDLIIPLATALYRSPQEFEIPLLQTRLRFRWRASADAAGIATLRCGGELASVSLLACGLDGDADSITLAAFQQHLLREWHDTGVEPAFTLLELSRRPLVATMNFVSPADPVDQLVTALADRCFGAAYFRYQHLV